MAREGKPDVVERRVGVCLITSVILILSVYFVVEFVLFLPFFVLS